MATIDRIERLDTLIESSLRMFVRQVEEFSWAGRENEAVSLFAFGCLLRHMGPKRKRLVCKDLVLWPEPGMTCSGPSRARGMAPAAILEWKRATAVAPRLYSEADLEWLGEFSREYRDTVGYAVTLGRHGEKPIVRCARVVNGRLKVNWVVA